MNTSEYLVDQLTNGVRVVTVPMPHLHAVELVCYVAVGGRCEPLPQSGISHFLEHMLFRGTAEFATSTELERAFEAIGGAVNASTDSETTCFHSRIHPDHVAHGVALFASMLRRPRFNDMDTERRIILEEAREDFNEKGEQINPDNLMMELLWPEHPLGASLIGSPQTLERIDRQRLEDYYRSWYHPDNLVICACGPVNRQQLVAAADREFGDWSQRPLIPIEPVVDSVQTQPQGRWVRDSDSQVSVQLAFRLPGRRDQRITAVRVLRRVLGCGAGARLPLRLREDLGLTYGVDVGCHLLDDTGCLTIDLAVAPASLVTVLGEMFTVLRTLREEAVAGDEFSAAVRTYLFDLEFSRDQCESLSMRYGWGLQAGYLRTLQQDREDLLALTPEQVRQAAAELFVPAAMNLVVVGPWSQRQRQQAEQLLHQSGL